MATAVEFVCATIGLFCPEPGNIERSPESTIPDQYNALPEREPKPIPPKPPEPKSGELVAPDSMNFGSVGVDEDVLRDIRIQNRGEKIVTISYLEMSGSTAFANSGNCPPIAGGNECVIKTIFRPEVAGPARGSIIIGWNGTVTRITLTGNGIAPPSPRPIVKRAPAVDPTKERELKMAEDALAYALGQPVIVPVKTSSGLLLNENGLGRSGYPWVISQPSYGGKEEKSKFDGDVSTLPVERCRTMKRDSFIPLILDQTINTQIAGPIIAHVDRDIYSVDGRLVLISKATKFIGKFIPLDKQGDTRISAEWEEMLRPDGASMVLSKTGAADAMGQSGLTGVVDNRFIEKYGTVVAAAAISAGIAFATQGSTSDDGTTTDGTFTAAGQALTQSLGQVTAEALRNTVNLAPRVTVGKGTLVHAIPGRQWYFPNAYQIVELGTKTPSFTYTCSGDFFRDLRGIAQNPTMEIR